MGEKENAGIPPASMEGRETRKEGVGWRALVGKGVLAAVVAVGLAGCSLGGPELSELQPGECFTGDVNFHPPTIEVIECSDANPMADYMVVFTEDAVGETYPGNLDEIGMRCVGEGGLFLQPSNSTWDDGDRTALCHKPPLMSESFEG